MEKQQPKKAKEEEEKCSQLYPRTGIIVSGEVFPFLMTCEEYDEYQKYLEEKKPSKE